MERQREEEREGADQERASASPQAAASPYQDVLFLQRHAGNAAVAARLSRSTAVREKPGRPTLARGEAGVHQNIEMTATGTQAPHLEHDLTGPGTMSSQQQAAMEMYSGNWMRDFSQFNVPTMFDIVSGLPRTPGQAGGGTLGAAGAEAFITGLLQTLASIEFGDEIATRMMTGPNIGVYRPEEHMDNTMGMTLAGDTLSRGPDGNLAPSTDASQVQGSAGRGSQIENQANYEVSASGMGEHIYNTTESVKNRIATGIELAASPATRPEGRMNIGAGLHGVEDYFSHSNFIEVGLNILLANRGAQPAALQDLPASPQGQGPVDTLYDRTVTVGGRTRQAITTGTFTARDTRVSIAHVLLPRLPGLFTTIDRAIDNAMFALQSEDSSWPAIQRQLSSDRAGQAFSHLIDGMQQANMELPAPELQTWAVPDLPDVLPDELEEALEGRWIAYGIDSSRYLAPHEAFAAYGLLISQARQIWNYREELAGAITAVLAALENIPFIGGLASVAELTMKLRQALALLSKTIDELIEDIRRQIKQRVREFMFSTIEQITGVDVPAEKREVLDDWLGAVQTGVEELSHSTSLEVQQREGGLANLPPGAMPPPGTPLPPSHSEISKDHPGHEDPAGSPDPHHGAPVTGHAHSLESLFFEIHQQLAVQADRHLTQLIDEAIRARDPSGRLVGDGALTLDARERAQRDREASTTAQHEAALATAEGRRFRQSTPGTDTPDVVAVMNAVDLYISHPDDTQWWRPIMQAHIDAEPEEVLHDIQERNRTRGLRRDLSQQGAIAQGAGHPFS